MVTFNDEIDYNSFCVLVKVDKISTLKEKLLSISQHTQARMLERGKIIYNKYFTLEGMSKQILRTLKDYEK